jgi:quinol monooxygenase YgiN
MVIVYGGVRVDPARVAEVATAADRFQKESAAEEGCVLYELSWQVGEENNLRLLEIWDDDAVHQAHKDAPHTAAWTEFISAAAAEAPAFTRHEFDA